MARREEAEITRNWPEDGEPLVTVVAICYCHEAYLRAALDSILAQETDFAFELIVHDDVSPDASPAIIREYAEAYPRIIRPVLESENQFSKGPPAMIRSTFAKSRGKYTAYLECDDFWTDPHKLQTQVDFLEAHPAYLAVAHNCTVVDRDGNPTGEQYPECRDEEYTADHFLHDILPGQAATLVARNLFTKGLEDLELFQTVPPGPFDRALYLTLLCAGRIFCIQKSMSAYRHITSGGTSFSATYRFDIRREARFYLSLALYCKRMGRIGDAIGMNVWLIDFLRAFIGGDVSREEAAPYLTACRASVAALTDQLTRRKRRCACCGQAVQYEALPVDEQKKLLAQGGPFLPETCNPDAYRCPNCGSTGGERLLAEALARLELRDRGRDCRILCVPAAPALDEILRADWSGAVCDSCGPAALSKLPDRSVDLILCSDVTGHEDVDKTLAGLRRVLKEDGCVLLLAEVDSSFSGVDEAWSLAPGETCRRYGRDGLTALLERDFSVRLLEKDFFGADCFRAAGLPDSAALYVLTGEGHAASFAEAKPELADGSARLVAYLGRPGDAGYSEEQSVSVDVPLRRRFGGSVPLPDLGEIDRLRLDPMSQPCLLRNIAVKLEAEDGEFLPVPIQTSNGLPCSDGLVFNSDDPQLELSIPQGSWRSVRFSCELLSLDAGEIGRLNGAADALARSEAELAHAKAERARLDGELAQTGAALARSEAEVRELTERLRDTRRELDTVYNSTSWKLTAPLRALMDAVKRLFRLNR